MQWLKKIHYWILVNGNEEEKLYSSIGILAIFGFPFFYFIWHFDVKQGYENLPLRLVAFILSLILLLRKYLPDKLKWLLPYYWYIYLMFIMPFFFTFMLLKNDGSTVWQLNGLLALILLVLLVNWYMIIILSFLGVMIAISAYYLTTAHPVVPNNIISIIVIYVPVLVFCLLFLYKREKINEDKLSAIYLSGAGVTHELKTSLTTISLFLQGLESVEFNLSEQQKYLINKTIFAANRQTKKALQLLKLYLTGISYKTSKYFTEKLSIKKVIDQARNDFINDTSWNLKIHIDINEDFEILANQSLMIMVVLNLIKNASEAIRAAQKGEIYISAKLSQSVNYLYIKDTALGIAADKIPFIFEQFYTADKIHGTGIGLAFCKLVIEAFRGSIVCHSKYGEFTEFTLKFPKIN